jgi:uncharacterized protein YcbX
MATSPTHAPRIAALYVYPIKSCAGITVDTMRFDALGPLDDRRWMLIDSTGDFVTQRELPALALVRPSRTELGLRVLAPGMPALSVTGVGGERVATRCWDDRCAGFDEGNDVAAWFGEYLGRMVRLLRFDTTAPRTASRNWVGESAGQAGTLTRFSDGVPLLVMSTASLAGLNVRLGQAGAGPAQVQRFRPNVVIDGVAPFEEDLIATITTLPDAGGAVSLRMVKPCTRCTIPEVDPLTARHQPGLLQVLASFRADPKLGGAVTFGQNAVIDSGLESALRVGDALHIEHRWH